MGMTLTAESSEDLPIIGSFIILWPADWWDKQYSQTDTNEFFEGQNDATIITNAHLRFKAWATSRAQQASAVQLFCPGFFALRVAGLMDSGAPEEPGVPANLIPDPPQNLFWRDWGHIERHPTSHQTPPGPVNRNRIVHRDFYLTNHSDIDLGDIGFPQPTFSFRIPRTVIRANQCLVIDVAGYNTFSGASVNIGALIAGTFGYIHRSRDA